MVALINTVFSIAENSNKDDVEELMFGYVKCAAPSLLEREKEDEAGG